QRPGGVDLPAHRARRGRGPREPDPRQGPDQGGRSPAPGQRGRAGDGGRDPRPARRVARGRHVLAAARRRSRPLRLPGAIAGIPGDHGLPRGRPRGRALRPPADRRRRPRRRRVPPPRPEPEQDAALRGHERVDPRPGARDDPRPHARRPPATRPPSADLQLAKFRPQVPDGLDREIGPPAPRPLVLASVREYHSALRGHLSYAHLVDDVVAGNPDDSAPGALQEAAWPVVEPVLRARAEDAAERFGDAIGAGRSIAGGGTDLLHAAREGRVDTLLLTRGRCAADRGPDDLDAAIGHALDTSASVVVVDAL